MHSETALLTLQSRAFRNSGEEQNNGEMRMTANIGLPTARAVYSWAFLSFPFEEGRTWEPGCTRRPGLPRGSHRAGFLPGHAGHALGPDRARGRSAAGRGRAERELAPQRRPPAARPNCRRCAASARPLAGASVPGEGRPSRFWRSVRSLFPRLENEPVPPFPVLAPEGEGSTGVAKDGFSFSCSLLRSRIFSSGSHLKHSKDAHSLHFRMSQF